MLSVSVASRKVLPLEFDQRVWGGAITTAKSFRTGESRGTCGVLEVLQKLKKVLTPLAQLSYALSGLLCIVEA